jgi:UDP-N-acetylglucosamine acyltransferase
LPVGGLSAVHQFINIGIVISEDLTKKDVPPFTKAAKEPLSYVGINSVGLREEVFYG